MRASKQNIDNFFKQQHIAVIGVSRSGNKFGNTVYNDLKSKGFSPVAVNANGGSWDGVTLYPDLNSVPQLPEGIITVVPPAITENVVKTAFDLGIKYVWMQPGSQSKTAASFCKEHGIHVVTDYCVLMFTPPVEKVHKFHAWILKLFRKYPK